MASRVMQELSALIFLRQQMSADTHVVHAHPVIPEMARNVQVGLTKVVRSFIFVLYCPLARGCVLTKYQV